MLKTLPTYLDDLNVGFFRSLYSPLLNHLDPKPSVQPKSHIPPPAPREPCEVIDIPLFTLVIEIVTGVATYRSRFERAFTILSHLKRNKALQTEFLFELHFFLRYLRMCFILGPPETTPSRFRTHAESEILLKRVPNHIYERLFRNIFSWGESFGFGHSSDPLTMLRDEVVVIGFVDWTARRHPDVYQSLLDGSHMLLQDISSSGRTRSTWGSSSQIPINAPDAGQELPATHTADDDELLVAYIASQDQLRFRSDYDRAVTTYRRATANENMINPFSSGIREIVLRLTAGILSSSSSPSSPSSLRQAMTIVDSCSRQESETFFNLMSRIAEQVGYSKKEGGIMATLIYEAALVGLASSLAKQRPDFIRPLLQAANLQILVPQTWLAHVHPRQDPCSLSFDDYLYSNSSK
jgi:hypothetical protein